jgi:predicted AAA+ superfamily ATPase
LEQVFDIPVLSLETILNNHFTEASQITSKVKVLQHFEKYIESGYYPFYREEGDGFPDRLQQVIDSVVTVEIPAVSHIEYDSVYKTKQLLAVLAEMKPYTLNISSLCTTLQSSRNNVLKLLDLMDKAALVRRLYATESGMNMLTKPEKILFYNTNLMYCLTPQVDSGTMRETYLASQVGVNHKLYMPSKGDLVVDGKWLFEVGGKGKGYSQIKDIQDSFVVTDNTEIGHGNKIPLWLFGLLY